jgi:predicted permease
MDSICNDVKYGVRSLTRTPAFTLSAILTLALGIGANSVIFTGVNHLLFDPMPFLPDQDRLVSVWEVAPLGRNDRNEFSLANFDDLRTSARSFSALAAHAWVTVNLTGGDRPERVQGFRVTANYFDTLGVQPLVGRAFQAGEDAPGRDDVVVISHRLWAQRFGAGPSIVGERIHVNGVPRTVVGILPEAVRYPEVGDLWMPLAYTPEQWTSRRGRFLLVTARLKPGVAIGEAQTEVRGIAARLASSYPDSNAGWSGAAQPLIADATRAVRPTLLVLFAAVGLVLLIACANVANLLLARASSRQRELAVRAALGAARGRLRQQLLIESLLVAIGGGTVAVVLSLWGVRAMVALVPPQHSRLISGFDRLAIDGTVLTFTASVSLVTALIFGVLPALKAAGRQLLPALQERSRGASAAPHHVRAMLVTAEVALAVVLLVAAGLALRSFRSALASDLGFDSEGVAATSVVLPAARYAAPAEVARFYDELVADLASLPGVTAAAAVNVTPLCQCNSTTSFDVDGRAAFGQDNRPDVGYRTATSDYFAVMAIPLRAGRSFTTQDRRGQPRVVIVNETLARSYFGEQSPIGQRLRFRGQEEPAEVVGVVADVRHSGPAQPPKAELFLAQAQEASRSMTLVVKTEADPAALLGPVRAAVETADPDQPVYDQRTMRDVVSISVGPFNFARQLLAAMAMLAVFLSAVGIYGVIAHVVGERTREIGIRLALGGTRRAVVRSVLAQALTPALWGVGVGLVGAGALSTALSAVLLGVHPIDPITFAGAATVLMVAALAAGYFPARRAAQVDPVVTLRSE